MMAQTQILVHRWRPRRRVSVLFQMTWTEFTDLKNLDSLLINCWSSSLSCMSVLNNYICPFAKNFLLLSLELFTAHMIFIFIIIIIVKTCQTVVERADPRLPWTETIQFLVCFYNSALNTTVVVQKAYAACFVGRAYLKSNILNLFFTLLHDQ